MASLFYDVTFFNFNPLPRKEGDMCIFLICLNFISYFNPLPRKEGDILSIRFIFYIVNFNPLPRKEGDPLNVPNAVPASISIHSLVKRETTGALGFTEHKHISIHSLVKRETGTTKNILNTMAISIHSLVKRETAAKCS